jgi:hypothetical protein
MIWYDDILGTVIFRIHFACLVFRSAMCYSTW